MTDLYVEGQPMPTMDEVLRNEYRAQRDTLLHIERFADYLMTYPEDLTTSVVKMGAVIRQALAGEWPAKFDVEKPEQEEGTP